ncbi:MAG: hypothetical protein EBR02_09850, partial [Alphaproteobacteria bacterium]|nr:hypothetical protein [Alphaproteobacteria bacterium]
MWVEKMAQGLKPEQETPTKAWLQEQFDIAVLQAKGEKLTTKQKELIENSLAYPKILKIAAGIVESATTDAEEGKKATYNDANIRSEVGKKVDELSGVMKTGAKPKGIGEAISNSFSKKFAAAKWDEDDISGSIGSFLSLLSPFTLFDALKDGIKQGLLSAGLDQFAAQLKSIKSKIFSAFGKGEALTVEQADNELRYQNAFAALGAKLEIQDTTGFGNSMAQK